MSVPDGARKVTYQIAGLEGEVEGPILVVEGNVDESTTETAAAMQAAAEAALSSLQTSFPLKTFTAGRYYTCVQTGDTWPVS